MGEANEIAKVLDKSIADDIYAVQEDFISTPLEKEYLRFKKAYFDFTYDIFNGNVPSSLAQSGNNQFKQQLIELKEGLKDPDAYLHGESEEELFVADSSDSITFVDITPSHEAVASVSDMKEVKKILFGDTGEKASKASIEEFFKLFEVSASSGKDIKNFFLPEQEEEYDEDQDEEDPF